MKKLIILACLTASVSLAAGTALADSIKGKLGVSGKIGFLVPADNDPDFVVNRQNNTDVGFVGGGGFIYGIDDHIAVEFEITRTDFGSNNGDFGITNVTLGGQYRFKIDQPKLVPYLGGGLDILLSDFDPSSGSRRDVDTTVGFHASGGLDYFIQRNIALNAEAKLLAAPDTSINDSSGIHRGDFDPSSFSTTFGIRYFFP